MGNQAEVSEGDLAKHPRSLVNVCPRRLTSPNPAETSQPGFRSWIRLSVLRWPNRARRSNAEHCAFSAVPAGA